MLSWLKRHWKRLLVGATAITVAVYLISLRRRQRALPRSRSSSSSSSSSETSPLGQSPRDDDELRGMFERAAQYVSSHALHLTDVQQLELYGLFKVATLGAPSQSAKASLWDYVAKAKYEAWAAKGSMSKEDARQAYIELVDALAPGWQGSPRSPSGRAPSPINLGGGGGGGTPSTPSDFRNNNNNNNTDDAMDSATTTPVTRPQQEKPSWHRVSVMAPVELTPVAAEDQDFLYHCKEGNLEQAMKMVQRDRAVLQEQDDDGATGLLWAVDRGYVDLVTALVEAGASIEHCDGDGSTALHYACMCNRTELVRYLLHVGAQVDVTDSDGLRPDQLTEDPEILELFQRQRRVHE